jgi:hypothetical protein
MTDKPVIPTTFSVREWRDPLLSSRGLRAEGIYTALVWGGLIGPTATVLLRLLVQLTTNGRVVEITVEELATTVGVSPSLALRGITRLARFGLVQQHGHTLSVRHFVDLVADGRVAKLSLLAQRVDSTYRQRVMAARAGHF